MPERRAPPPVATMSCRGDVSREAAADSRVRAAQALPYSACGGVGRWGAARRVRRTRPAGNLDE
jgi:hypothetical protein